MLSRGTVSFRKMFATLKSREMPRVKIKWRSSIAGRKMQYLSIETLHAAKIGRIMMKPKRKLRKFAHTIESVIASRGMTNWLRMPLLPVIEVADSDMEFAKKFQGKRALNTRSGKCLISVFMMQEKTKEIAHMMRRGCMTAQESPKTDPTYLSLRFLRMRLLIARLCNAN